MPPSRNASGKGCRSRRRCRSARIGWHPSSRHVLVHCIDRDIKALAALGKTGFLKIMAVTHTGITTDDFLKFVADWITITHHPCFNRLYTELVSQPMIELLSFPRQRFSRPSSSPAAAWSSCVSSPSASRHSAGAGSGLFRVVRYQLRSGDKPVGINRFIGRRPVFAFGNSDVDQEMLEWTAAGTGAFMGLCITRRRAYDRKSRVGRLEKAWDEAVRHGWTVTNMKTEWKKVFAFEP